MLLMAVSAWKGDMSPEALKQMLHFVTLDSSRGGRPLKAEWTAMLEIGLDFVIL